MLAVLHLLSSAFKKGILLHDPEFSGLILQVSRGRRVRDPRRSKRVGG